MTESPASSTSPSPTASADSLARANTRARSNFQMAARRFFRSKLATFGLALTLSLVVIGIFAPQLAPTHYNVGSLLDARELPSGAHWFGTDNTGRDYLSRTIYAVRTSLIVALGAVSISVLIGLPLGIWAGLKGGYADFIVQRLVEIMTAFPGILFAIVLIAVVNSGVLPGIFTNQVLNVIIVIGVTSWVTLARLSRALVLQLRESEYVSAARSIGATDLEIGYRHLLPNALAPLVVAITLAIPAAIFTEAGLSFLGIGINEPLPSLGKMVADSRQYIQLYWHLGFFPAMAIALTVLGFTFLGDGLRDALDPRQNN
jgi:oligopeptide transport system permease protein